MISQPYDLLVPYLYTIIQIALAIIIPIIIMKFIVKAITKYDDEDSIEKTLIRKIITLIHYLTVILIIVLILSILGIDLQSFILSLGLASVAVSLAAKDTLSNIISGIIIMLEKNANNVSHFKLSLVILIFCWKCQLSFDLQKV